ncbi:hypothetical protein CsSME_00001450 [Camellia sinensis var. sinensis]
MKQLVLAFSHNCSKLSSQTSQNLSFLAINVYAKLVVLVLKMLRKREHLLIRGHISGCSLTGFSIFLLLIPS